MFFALFCARALHMNDKMLCTPSKKRRSSSTVKLSWKKIAFPRGFSMNFNHTLASWKKRNRWIYIFLQCKHKFMLYYERRIYFTNSALLFSTCWKLVHVFIEIDIQFRRLCWRGWRCNLLTAASHCFSTINKWSFLFP